MGCQTLSPPREPAHAPKPWNKAPRCSDGPRNARQKVTRCLQGQQRPNWATTSGDLWEPSG